MFFVERVDLIWLYYEIRFFRIFKRFDETVVTITGSSIKPVDPLTTEE